MAEAENVETKIAKPAKSPSTIKAHQYLELCWTKFMLWVWPDVSLEAHWHVGIVNKGVTKFFYYLVHTIKPHRKGIKYMKAWTLFQFMTLLIHLVICYMFDPATSKKCEMTNSSSILAWRIKHSIICTPALHPSLSLMLLAVICHFDLDRYYDQKWYYWCEELQLLIDTAMHSQNMCLVKINVILRMQSLGQVFTCNLAELALDHATLEWVL
ncbi:hypothetical protein IW261DRAFT_1427716 [Armillaria novae-zelandiae]|uniref:Uncharacterized protein n=1 Tax=Armillaria novae-zelandiae TaxID=153914 RepID=A0AA39TQW1_9AGAR|nr:hypothetical protein IW261DRAFT_1427716 [Armillaria novae-zelandiae]